VIALVPTWASSFFTAYFFPGSH
ncbi:hypothetical protein, partial [Treponema pallidum]